MTTTKDIEAVRRFNRFYTRKIGVLQESLSDSPFSLAEARVLYELAGHPDSTAKWLGEELGLDAGYLSRILRRFEADGLIMRRSSESDARQQLISLTARGRNAFSALVVATSRDTGTMLRGLTQPDRARLIDAMQEVTELLGAQQVTPQFTLRSHGPGDMGWVVQLHGELYAAEYGWNAEFEALVAEIVAKFLRNFDERAERCWIAELGGERVGSVFLVRKSKTVGQLRLLLVDPRARGLGIGKKLVAECIEFARSVGYRKIVLWTNDVLHAARHIYEQARFTLVEEYKHDSFGHSGLVAQTWALRL
jgi:DNA-binding MarR family transcriptional regulator/GNAT superfamily N-acetyltransferase